MKLIPNWPLRLVSDWRAILTRAWSVLSTVLFAVLSSLSLNWPTLSDKISPTWFIIGGAVITILLRILAQPDDKGNGT